MPTEYMVILLAVAALIVGALYLMTRRRRKKKKSAPPGRPAASATWVRGALLGRVEGARRRLGPPCRRAGSGACTRARVPDGAVLESACSAWMERWSAGCGALRSGTARFSSSVDRLGRSRRFGARVTADRRAFLGKSGSGVVGHPQDRRTRRPARALLARASRAPTGL